MPAGLGGRVAVGMARQGFDLQLTRYDHNAHFSMVLRTHARVAVGKTRRATKRAPPKIFDASRMIASGYQPRRSCDRQRSGNSIRYYARSLGIPRATGCSGTG
jgi:hypothetical protein